MVTLDDVVCARDNDSSNFLGCFASSTMAGIPNVSTTTTAHDTLLGQNHCYLSDHDKTETEEDYLSLDEEDDDDIEALAVEDDDGMSTHNNNQQITKPKNKALTTCAEAYKASDNNKAVLIAMGIGLKGLCMDISEEPYKSRNRQSFVPTSKELIGEIQRWAIANGLPGFSAPKQGNWDNNKRILWLENNPIKASSEKEWVKQQISEFDKVFCAGISECNNDAAIPRDVWNGHEHYLCFYHVMMEDSIRVALLALHKSMDHAELDARNSA
jgi:hypothetical protein